MSPSYAESGIDNISIASTRDYGGMSTPSDRIPIIEEAEITAVYPTYLVDVVTKTTGRVCRNLSVGGLGVGRSGGTLAAMPEIGDLCLICHPSDSMIPKILLYLPYISRTSGARGNRRHMDPGDRLISTGSGNFVHLHAGGVVDVGANPVTRRIFVPILNQIKDICENYGLATSGGSIQWVSKRDRRRSGGVETEYIWEIKTLTSAKPLFFIRRGAVTSVTDMGTEVIAHEELRPGNDVLYRNSLDIVGNALLQSQGVSEESWGKKVIGGRDGVILTSTEFGHGEIPDPHRGRISATSADGVELGEALEPGVLGDTLVDTLSRYNDIILALLEQLKLICTAMSTGATTPITTQAAVATAGTAITAAATTAQNQLNAISQQFRAFLAADTKLS